MIPAATGNLDKDTATLRALVKGGIPIPSGHWRVRGPIVYPLAGGHVMVEANAVIEYVEPERGWASGFLFCSEGYRIAGRPRAHGLVSTWGPGAKILILDNGCIGPRKGFGVTDTNGFMVDGLRVEGPELPNTPDTKQFAIQIHNSSGTAAMPGVISHSAAMVQASGQGADGFHLTGNCSYVRFQNCLSDSGDDASSATHELPSMPNSIIDHIDFIDCTLANRGHSAIKGLSLSVVGSGSVIRRLSYLRCDLVTTLGAPGQGAPIWIENRAGTIEDVSVTGGKLRVVVPPGGQISGPTIHLKGVKRFKLQGTAIKHYSRTLLHAVDCPDILFDPLSVQTLGTVSKPGVPRPLVLLTGCERADIRTAKLAPAYTGQSLL